jgi:hypothetical protein
MNLPRNPSKRQWEDHLNNGDGNPVSGHAHYRLNYNRIAILVAVPLAGWNIYTTASGLFEFFGLQGGPLDTIFAAIFSFTNVTVLFVTSMFLGEDLSLVVTKWRKARRGLLPRIITFLMFLLVLQTATFFSFLYYYSTLFPSKTGILEPPALAVEALLHAHDGAWLALFFALCQSLVFICFRFLASASDSWTDEQVIESVPQQTAERSDRHRWRGNTSVVGMIGRSIKLRALAMVGLAGIASVYCFFLSEDGKVLAWVLLACAAWGGIDVLYMSRRLWSGCYGDADYELRELVVPLVARIRTGSKPSDPDRIFPDRAAEQAPKVPSGLAVIP